MPEAINNSFKKLRENYSQQKILYLARLVFKSTSSQVEG